MPGYIVSAADREKIPAKYLCSYCRNPLRDPLQTPCGHYCQTCAVALTGPDGAVRCVQDDKLHSPEELFRDNFMKREVQELSVSCPYDTVCVWAGKIRDLEYHESECLFVKLPCPNTGCTAVVQRLQLQRHLEKCAHACAVTNQSTQSQMVDQSYGSVNPSHVTAAAANKEPRPGVRCLFDVIGCRVSNTLTDAQLQEHMQACATHHTQLLFNYSLKLEKHFKLLMSSRLPASSPGANLATVNAFKGRIDEILSIAQRCETQLLDHSGRISMLEKKVARDPESSGLSTAAHAQGLMEITRRLRNTENTTADLGLLIGELNGTMGELQRKVQELERRHTADQQVIRQLHMKLEALDNAQGSLAQLENRLDTQSLTTFHGTLLWRITDVARHRRDSADGRQSSLYSPPFYTDRYGYKCCARIYFNGDGLGRGTHISVFFVLMRGEFDALLRWPFRQKVTLMLLDQDNVNHVIDAFRTDPSSSSFQRPKREMNVASGCPLFCPLSELNKHAYVRDDTMFLKVIVDNNDM